MSSHHFAALPMSLSVHISFSMLYRYLQTITTVCNDATASSWQKWLYYDLDWPSLEILRLINAPIWMLLHPDYLCYLIRFIMHAILSLREFFDTRKCEQASTFWTLLFYFLAPKCLLTQVRLYYESMQLAWLVRMAITSQSQTIYNLSSTVTGLLPIVWPRRTIAFWARRDGDFWFNLIAIWSPTANIPNLHCMRDVCYTSPR